MKNALRFALLSAMALVGVVSVCRAAQQTPAAPQASQPALPLQRFTVLRNVHVLGPTVDMTADQANCAITGASDNATVKCKPIGVTQKSAYTYNVALVAQADGTAYVIACRIGLISNLWCKSLAEGRILRGTLANGHLMVPDGNATHDYAVLKTAQIGALDTDQPEVAAAPALGDLPAACISADAADKENSACVSFTSEPSGADIYVDGKFVGNTPSLLPLPAGSHDIRIEAAQRKAWTRTLQAAAAGKITIHADLEAADK